MNYFHCVLRAFACVVLLRKRTPRAQAWQRESQFNFPGILTGCWLRIAPSFHRMMEKKQGKNYVKKKPYFKASSSTLLNWCHQIMEFIASNHGCPSLARDQRSAQKSGGGTNSDPTNHIDNALENYSKVSNSWACSLIYKLGKNPSCSCLFDPAC